MVCSHLGNLDDEPNTNYVYKEKPNNIGLYIGNVANFDSKNGHITFKTNANLKVGDKIGIEKEDHKYTISELMMDSNNITLANPEDFITIGRVRGNINPGDKIYKLTSISHSKQVQEYYQKEHKKIPLAGNIVIKKGLPLYLVVTSLDDENGIYFSMSSLKNIDVIPVEATNNPITEQRIAEQLCKTGSYPFEFKKVNIILDDNVFIPKISAINTLRRQCLDELMDIAITRFERDSNIHLDNFLPPKEDILHTDINISSDSSKKISLQLNELNLKYDYSKLSQVDNIYVPLQYFLNDDYSDILKLLSSKSALYITLPVVLKDNFRNYIFNDFDKIIKKFDVKGLVISNISFVKHFKEYIDKLNIVANYNLNVFNSHTIDELKDLNISRVTLSPELNKKSIQYMVKNSSIPTELICYGRLPLMNTGYCLLGSSNKCYPTCTMQCNNKSKFYIQDRLGLNFRIIPNSVQTVTTIYNSKITSISHSNINTNYVRIDILDENIKDINLIIKNVTNDIVFEGNNYTKGNFNKSV